MGILFFADSTDSVMRSGQGLPWQEIGIAEQWLYAFYDLARKA